MDDNTEVERARFEWRAFRRTLAVWTIDFCCAASVVAALWYFVRYCVFDGERIPASAHEVAEIVIAIAWPSAILLVLLLFRNPLLRILNEVPSLVRRSFYRHGVPMKLLEPDDESKELSEENDSAETSRNSERVEIREPSANAIGRWLVKKYGGHYSVGKCIGSRRFVFDAVIETPTRLYGVEMKMMCREDVWRRVLDRVKKIYDDLPETTQRRFVFISVVFDDAMVDVVECLAREFKFKTEVERYCDGKEN